MDEVIAQLTAVLAKAAIEVTKLGRDKLSIASTSYPLQPPFSSVTREDWVTSVRLWLTHGPQLLAELPNRPCPACGCTSERNLFESYDGYPFAECNECRSWFVPKRVDMTLFNNFFVRCPESRQLAEKMLQGRSAAASEQADRGRIVAYLDELVEIAGDNVLKPRYLDTGCGVGNSLIAALDRGIEAVGVDTDEIAVSIARARGYDVRHTSEALPDGLFDFISFWESLEHISDPLEALKRYSPLLRPRGLIALTVPNLNSSLVRVMRGDCPYVNGGTTSPGHINLFSLPGLHRLLAQAGLSLIDADVQYSNNPIDLFAYLFGQSRGATDMLADSDSMSIPFPDIAMKVLNSIWPAVNMIERILLTGPILKITACRKGAESLFEQAVGSLQDRRRKEVIAQAQEILRYQ